MLNFRKIDKFYLSGGWNKLPENIDELKVNNVKAVLDLQFSTIDSRATIKAIKELLEKNGIDYQAIDMYDSEFNISMEDIFFAGQEFLSQMETKYPAKREGILVKCAAGISRSPAMLINYFCNSRRMSYAEALNYLRKREEDQGIDFGSSPNQYFSQYLKEKYK